MRPRAAVGVGVLAVVLAVGAFALLQRQLSGAWFLVGANPEIVRVLEGSLEDQRELARVSPERAPALRRRYEETRATLAALRVLEESREAMQGRFELVLSLGVALLGIGGVVVWAAHERSTARRLERLAIHLADLAAGAGGIEVEDHRRDTIGRVARLVERTSRAVENERRRLAQLAQLERWQEAARRHAHELRPPLTVARLELERIGRLCSSERDEDRGRIAAAAASGLEEIDRVAAFLHRFTAFSRLPSPRLEVRDLAALAAEFAATYEGAWPNLDIVATSAAGEVLAAVDREMLRQVLAILCDNASRAVQPERGSVSITTSADRDHVVLDVVDTGPGVDETVRDRLFEPYVTTRRSGEGMGLGLAIARKIALEHGGDLELLSGSGRGAAFRLSLPREEGLGG